jgi:hypothetical protein
MKQSWSLFRGQWADPSTAQTPTRAPLQPRARVETTGKHLALVDDKAYVKSGYNPYDTVVHVRDTRTRDVWRTKPKRA